MERRFGSLAGIAGSRFRSATHRLRRRATLIAIAAFLALLAFGFALAAATTALADEIGRTGALLVMAGLALAGLLVMLGLLAAEAREAREIAARRASLEGELARAALLGAAIPRLARPSRGVVGLALVALGAFLVLGRRD